MEKRILYLFDKYLSGTITEDERKELLDWISSNKKLQKQLERNFAAASDAMDKAKQEEMLKYIHRQIQPRRSVMFRHSKALHIAAMIIFPLVIAGLTFVFLVKSNVNEAQYLTIEAQRGQKTNITLPDGSKVYLNSESELVYGSDFNKKERRLTLNGEAYFEVSQNREIPFIVSVGSLEVQAVGTAFNISSYKENAAIRTNLTEGKIKVTVPGETLFLSPDEQLTFYTVTGKYAKQKLDDAKKTIGWMDNQLYFDNASFAEIAATLGRIYNIDIYFSTESLKSYHFSGSIKNNSLESVFRILSLTSPIQYEIKDGHVELHEVQQKTKYFQ